MRCLNYFLHQIFIHMHWHRGRHRLDNSCRPLLNSLQLLLMLILRVTLIHLPEIDFQILTDSFRRVVPQSLTNPLQLRTQTPRCAGLLWQLTLLPASWLCAFRVPLLYSASCSSWREVHIPPVFLPLQSFLSLMHFALDTWTHGLGQSDLGTTQTELGSSCLELLKWKYTILWLLDLGMLRCWCFTWQWSTPRTEWHYYLALFFFLFAVWVWSTLNG